MMALSNIRFKTQRFFLLLVLVFASSCSRGHDTEVPHEQSFIAIQDTQFEMQLIALGIDTDQTVNQQLLRTDAEAVEKLDLNLNSNHGEISNLSGIEGFSNLRVLSAVGQELKNIDLSHNIYLDSVYLSGNLLTEIDISALDKLVYLDVQSNQLSSIQGISSSSTLKYLNLSFNDFTSLNVDNSSLEVLYLSHNLLTQVDLNEAKGLKNVLIIINQLTEVDFSSNINLETLVISGNQLEYLDMSNNVKLTHLYCSSNSLLSLDISSNSNLIDLRADRNPNLTCIKTYENQLFASLSLSEYQELNTHCE